MRATLAQRGPKSMNDSIQEPVGALPGLRTPGAERREIDGDGLGLRRGLHQRRPARDVNLRLRDAVALERQLPVALVERHAQPARLPGPDDERRQEDDVGQKHGIALGVGGTGAERRARELEEAGAGDERFAATNHVLAQEPMTLAAELDVEGDRRVGLREPVVGGGQPAQGRRGLRLWRRRRGRSRFGPRDPVALAFERVGRQRHAAAAFRSVTALPVDVGTVGPEAADGRLEERQRGFGLAGMRQRLHGPGGAAQLRAHQARQGAAGADLHVHPGRFGAEARQTGRELHRVPQVVHPVARIRRLRGGDPLTRQVGDVASLGGREGDGATVPLELGEDGREHLRVRGHRDVDAYGIDLARGQQRLQRRDRLVRARDDAQLGRVDGGDGQARQGAIRGQHGAHLSFSHRHAQHAAGREGLEQTSAQADQRQGGLVGQHAGQAGRDVLAHAVADHRVRRDAP